MVCHFNYANIDFLLARQPSYELLSSDIAIRFQEECARISGLIFNIAHTRLHISSYFPHIIINFYIQKSARHPPSTKIR
jgi:hypothetical protein